MTTGVPSAQLVKPTHYVSKEELFRILGWEMDRVEHQRMFKELLVWPHTLFRQRNLADEIIKQSTVAVRAKPAEEWTNINNSYNPLLDEPSIRQLRGQKRLLAVEELSRSTMACGCSIKKCVEIRETREVYDSASPEKKQWYDRAWCSWPFLGDQANEQNLYNWIIRWGFHQASQPAS